MLLLVVVLLYRACAGQDNKPVNVQGKPQADQVASQESQAAEAKRLCLQSIDDKKRQYADLAAKKQHWEAASAIRLCADTLADDELKNLVRTSEIASLMEDINNPKTPARDRARAMQMLARDYPDVGAKYEQQAKRLIEDADKKDQEELRRKKRSEGVRVGMSKEDVLASSWGKPEKINTTTTARLTREQWVYGGRNYLYFENGVLVTIQN